MCMFLQLDFIVLLHECILWVLLKISKHILIYSLTSEIYIGIQLYAWYFCYYINCIYQMCMHMHTSISVCVRSVASIESDWFQLYGLWPARLLCLWDFPGNNTRVGCYAFRRSSSPRDQICVYCGSWIAGRFFTTEPPWKSHYLYLHLDLYIFNIIIYTYIDTYNDQSVNSDFLWIQRFSFCLPFFFLVINWDCLWN